MNRIILLIFSVIPCFSSCLKNCSETVYSFDIHAKVFPDIDSIYLGDTVWVEANSPVMVKDKTSENNIDYSGAGNLGIELKIVSLQPASGTFAGITDATQTFHYSLQRGTLYTSDQYAVNYRYEESDSMYRFLVGCVPKDTGTYRLYISDAINVFRKENKCDKATFSMSIINTNQHFKFYSVIGPDVQPDSFALQHYYCFHVSE